MPERRDKNRRKKALQWEYSILTVGAVDDAFSLDDMLSEGWELVSAVHSGVIQGRHLLSGIRAVRAKRCRLRCIINCAPLGGVLLNNEQG